jgi:hypothetical protein
MESRELVFDTLLFSMMRRRCESVYRSREVRHTAHAPIRCELWKRRGSHGNGLHVFCDMLAASTVL